MFMQFDSNNSLSLSVSLPQSTTYLSTFNRNIYSYTYIYILKKWLDDIELCLGNFYI